MPKKKTLAQKKQSSKSEDLIERVVAVNRALTVPKQTAAKIYFKHFKEEGFTDSVKNMSKVRNVLYYRVTDEKITSNLEKLIEII